LRRGNAIERNLHAILLDRWSQEEQAERMRAVEACLSAALELYPDATPGKDNFTRLTDRTVDVSADVNPEKMAELARHHGVHYTYSTVHHHFGGSQLDKASGLARAMEDHLDLSEVSLVDSVITLGDSFNDAPLFADGTFAATVAILKHLEALAPVRPGYVTLTDASQGFVELAGALLDSGNGTGKRS
jgi:hydroxymethylpyrimidine pyrophosphatase-like HAD family hydrolase